MSSSFRPPRSADALADRPVYVPVEPYPVFALRSPAHPDAPPATPVLLVGPFGWEDIAAYRALRTWAHHLARRGHPTLRFDLPGTGDSAGSADSPGLVEAWGAAIRACAAWLAADAGTGPVAVVGLGLPGLVVADAIRDAPAIGDLVLWGVGGKGRGALRQLQAFARMERSSESRDEHGNLLPEEPEEDDGRLAPGGFLLSDETQAALRAVDLTTLPADVLGGRRVLLLERDGMTVDGKLRSHLEAGGASVSVAPGDGYGAMVEHPQSSTAPRRVLDTVDDWLAAGTAPTGPPAVEVGAAAGELLLGGVRETPLSFGSEGPAVFGVLAEPDGPVRSDVTVVFLNAGAQRRVGPNRMWTEASRRWAADGVPSARIDVGSLGDAPGPDVRLITGLVLHDESVPRQVVRTLDALVARGLPPRFMLVGLCSGAWIAYTSALDDPRVRGVVLFNARALVWSESLADGRDAAVGRRVVKGSQWKRVLRGEISRERILEIVRAIVRMPISSVQQRRVRRGVAATIERHVSGGAHVTLVFTGKEPLRDELERDGHLETVRRSANLRLVELSGRDHTLRPLAEQRAGHEVLDAELARVRGT